MSQYPKRLIEVDLPIKRISAHARREKDSRLGHIPRLHIYPAARPAAACRAVACAALWPDPSDPSCPLNFQKDAFRIIKDFSREAMNNRVVRDELLSEYTLGRVMTINHENSNFDLDNSNSLAVLRQTLLDFIADFANWDASTNLLFLKTARALTTSAYDALGGIPNTRHIVFDPFAGGGAIPLEASRIGAESVASDLNPLSVLLNKVLLEYLPKYGVDLCLEIEQWVKWVSSRAKQELSKFYSTPEDGSKTVAYLWARTIISTAPSPYKHPIEIPLLKTMVLSRSRNRMRALRWCRDSNGKVVLKQSSSIGLNGQKIIVLKPQFEVFVPISLNEVEPGTVLGKSATCPVTGNTMRMIEVQKQLATRRGGASDARLYCVVFDPADGSLRDFRIPFESEKTEALAAEAHLEKKFGNRLIGSNRWIPDEPTPLGGGKGAGRAFAQRSYNMSQFRDLFHPRQLLSLLTYIDLVREYVDRLRLSKGADFAIAVNACLGLLLDRMADLNASLCVWQLNTPNTAHVFGRWVLQMTFDFGEVNPLAGAGGSPESAAARMVSCLNDLKAGDFQGGTAYQSSADNQVLPDDFADLLFTDPPYYDAVPYSDLLDFFYVWLKRSLNDGFKDLFVAETGPKESECIVDEIKGKTPEYFEAMMKKCLLEARRIIKPSGIGVVVFAHKSTGGWEHMIQALIDAGWTIIASWPIDTEMASRLRAKNSAVLASSIHLVCRPRDNLKGSLRNDDIGDWRDVLNELPRRIHEWMPRLAQEGVVGADAIFACLGPALEIFSHYTVVEKASGEKVELKEYLEHVWAAVAREALNMIFQGADVSGFEEDARLTAMWLWTRRTQDANGHAVEAVESDESEEDAGNVRSTVGGYRLEYDAARKIAQGLGAHLEALDHLVEVKGDTAILLSAGARTRYLFGKEATQTPKLRRRNAQRQLTFDFALELENVEEEAGLLHGNLSARPGATMLDQLHQSMILFGAGRGEALKRFLMDEGVGRNPLFWRLAQAFSALYPASSEEKRWVDGVMARKKGLGL